VAGVLEGRQPEDIWKGDGDFFETGEQLILSFILGDSIIGDERAELCGEVEGDAFTVISSPASI
jgi:hypothetical protein